MAITLKHLETKSAQIIEKMKSIADKPGLMKNADQEEFDRLETELNRILKQRNILKASEVGGNNASLQNDKSVLDELPDELKLRAEKLALSQFLKHGTPPTELKSLMQSTVRLAQQSTTDGSGGYTVPNGLVNELEKGIKDFAGMWETATVKTTDRGNTTSWGMVNDTDKKAYLIAESADGTNDAEPVAFGTKEFNGYKYTSGVIQVPAELLQDSEYFAEEFVNVLSERFYRGTNEDFSIGNGTGKPNGITNAAVYGVSSADDGAISYDDLVNLKHSVDPGYRKTGSGVWMFHDSVLKQIELIKDTANQPVFNIDNGIILGHKFVINQNLPVFTPGSTSANDNKKSILFGDMSKYVIRKARNMRIVRLSNRFADLDQIAFVVFMRVDGDLLNPGTDPVKYLRVSGT